MIKLGKPRTSKGLATFCARLALNKLANDILILNLKNIDSAPSDYFVICTSKSTVQSQAISEDIVTEAKHQGLQVPRTEGLGSGQWVLVDFFDVVVHVMLKETREYYKLEKLWGDAEFFELTEENKIKSFKSLNINSVYDSIESK